MNTYRLFLILATALFAAAPATLKAARATATDTLPVVYVNREYSFRLTLPHTWKGDIVLVRHDVAADPSAGPNAGPAPPRQDYTVITIRHPRWTEAHPWEDLPIMVFTLEQWDAITSESGTLLVSAAPFPPSELSRNARYVFALPARYNYDYSSGWKALERILKTHPLQGF